MKDTVNAFVDIFTIPGKEGGPLTGLTFGAKDIYDIQGRMTGCGSPDWAASHPVAERTAPAVQALLDAGFSGWCTVEQDCDPTLDPDPLGDARKNRDYLTSIGFD